MSLRLGETLIAGSVTQTIDLSTILFALFPVGAIYQGNMSECPLAALMPNTTWELVSQGKVLQGADEEHPLGSEIPQMLPQLYGDQQFGIGSSTGTGGRSALRTAGGVFQTSGTVAALNAAAGTAGGGQYFCSFNASNYNSIYSGTDKVQPAAYAVNIWERKS